MAFLSFNGVGISGMAAAIPRNTIKNLNYTQYFSEIEAKNITEKTGIYERRFAAEGVTSSDLCFEAAEKLITDMKICKEEIGLLVFVSQTPDFRMPATSILLQNRLGLSKQTIAFDLTMGCSGFIYGLSVVYSLMERNNLGKALLLDGETRSRVYSPKDRKTAFLFGDGGVAALISQNENFGRSFFSLNSDGSREELIKIKGGGYRFPSSSDTVIEKEVDEYGNIRSDEHGYMNGSEVFNFVIKEIPPDINRILNFAGMDQKDIDFFVLHQANEFMNSYLIKKMKLDTSKVPSTISKFGNTSSVSIPLTMVSELKNSIVNKRLLLSGFGVGMSWASALIKTESCFISDIVEI